MVLITTLVHGGKHAGGSEILGLLKVTSFAIVETALLCVVGYFLGRAQVIDGRTKRTLNKLNQSLFTPCLLFGKVAYTLTPSKLAELWIVPLGFVIISLVSALIAYAMAFVFRLSKSQRAFAIACATFMNSNSLPIALMQSLTVTVSALKWGDHDTRDAMLGRALSYLVLFSTLGIVLRWSYGIKLLSTADDEAPKEEDQVYEVERGQEASSTDTAVDLSNGQREDEAAYNDRVSLLRTENGQVYGTGNGQNGESPKRSRFADGPVTIGRPPGVAEMGRRSMPQRRWTALGSREDAGEHTEFFHKAIIPPRNFRREIADYRSFPNTPARTPAASSYASSEGPDSDEERDTLNEEDEDEIEGLGRRDRTEPSHNRTQAWLRRNRRKCSRVFSVYFWKPTLKFLKGVQAFMTAPLYAALASLIVACIPPLQNFLDELQPLRGAVKSAGNCSVPITLIVLGSYFVEQPAEKLSKSGGLKKKASTSTLRERFSAMFTLPKRDSNSNSAAKPGETRTVFVSVVSRMIVAPLVLIPLLALWSIKTHNVADDPVFIVTAVLVIGSAPAITLAQMTTAAGNSFERLVSRTLFVSYVVVTFPSTIVLVLIGLEIAKKQ